jgi:hypothetical protein
MKCAELPTAIQLTEKYVIDVSPYTLKVNRRVDEVKFWIVTLGEKSLLILDV